VDSTRAPSLIISKKDSLQDGLVALLTAMPQLGLVQTSDALDEAILGSAPDCSPALVLLDARVSGDSTWAAVRRVRARWPGSKTVVLTDDAVRRAEAEAAGADATLMSGLAAARLVAAIVRLLPHADAEDLGEVSFRRTKPRIPRIECTSPPDLCSGAKVDDEATDETAPCQRKRRRKKSR
jgi:DNA-binding NarL/FixJ family response regulator